MWIEPEISGVSIVLVGNFNPAIFTPAWFVLHDLLPKHTTDEAKLEIAHPEITAFSTEWLHLQVAKDRFVARTQKEPYIQVRDLLVRVFKDHLSHTPLQAFGINREVHFRVASRSERDRIGRLLAPVEPWGQWGKKLGLDSEDGGMSSLTMMQTNPADPSGGRATVTIEPSRQIAEIANDQSGIYVKINDHYEERARLMDFLEDGFDSSIQRSNDIIDHIMSLGTDQNRKGS